MRKKKKKLNIDKQQLVVEGYSWLEGWCFSKKIVI